ncbi:YpjP family protein [Halobacillus litoralis]|uniref:YpjP family protein n=1 Tax=Halobacillus litoralis TaxID=45668 RepID=UPI0024913EC8|nr:YpjP family protein [Halobacillus litoralis]
MNPLLRKICVVLISAITLGMYVPPTLLDADAAEKKELTDNNHLNESSKDQFTEENIDIVSPSLEEVFSSEAFIENITEQAKSQTVTKMGPRIIEKVDEDMTAEILPKIEEVVTEILSSAGEEEVPYYEITEEATPGYGEKIFNLYNHHTNEEIARFHVRRDKRPGEGYWFNFHYHLKTDGFVKHHNIGDIYWEKNTPPKWMS